MLEMRTRHPLAPGFTLEVDFRTDTRRLGVFGASGAGKSSLLNALAGVRRPAEATITCDDIRWDDPAAGIHVPLHRRRVGYMTQDALLFPHCTVEANLRYSPAGRTATSRFIAVVDVLGLGPLLARAPRNLSGGEQNRVALGRALLSDPALLLLDEPFAGLDAGSRRAAMALLDTVHTAFGIPWVLVSHRDADLVVLADEVLVLAGGRIIGHGPPLDCMAAHALNPQALAHDIDNLLRGPITRMTDTDALVELAWGDHALLAPAPVNGRSDATYGCYANSIVLSIEEPTGQSARNHLRAEVEALHPIGTECVVDLNVGGQRLRALVLERTVDAMGLAIGSPVIANVKTTSLTPLG